MTATEEEKHWWNRDTDAMHTIFTTGDDVDVERFYECRRTVLRELTAILERELSYTRDGHLIRLKLEVQLCR